MLASNWVDSIHSRLLVRYGSRWVNLYASIDPELVKADWAEVLSGVTSDGIKHALDHLPVDAPPNAAQFRSACIRVPVKAPPALPAPQLSDARRAQVGNALRELRLKLTGAA